MKNAQKTLEKQLAAEAEAEAKKVQDNTEDEAQEQPADAETPTQVGEEKKPIVLNQQQIDEWKKQYGKIFRTTIGSSAFIWHRLSRKDYVSLMTDEGVSADEDERLYQRQEMAVKAAVLWPENVEEVIQEEGCVASNLGGVIMERSGFRIPVTDEM